MIFYKVTGMPGTFAGHNDDRNQNLSGAIIYSECDFDVPGDIFIKRK